jgi:hypothetical protein
MIYRRQRKQYVFAIFLAVLAVLNVMFYFILTRRSQTEFATLHESIERLEKQVGNSQKYFDQLGKSSEALGKFDEDKDRLLMMRMVKRTKGYSELLAKLDGIAKDAGVRKTSVSYTRFPTPMPGMESVAIAFPVEGNYTNIVKFIRELENSETFFLVTSIAVQRASQSSGQPGALAAAAAGAGGVGLSLTLETYFYQ